MPGAEKDFVEFIELLNKNNVEYLIVGAYALAVYTRPRNTGDIDILINPTIQNAEKIIKVLEDFGFSNTGIDLQDFLKEGQIIQLGVNPVRIDLLTSIDGVSFNDCYLKREQLPFGSAKANFISRVDLMENKRSSGRSKDKADYDELKRINSSL